MGHHHLDRRDLLTQLPSGCREIDKVPRSNSARPKVLHRNISAAGIAASARYFPHIESEQPASFE
jgi:hypothetical protein